MRNDKIAAVAGELVLLRSGEFIFELEGSFDDESVKKWFGGLLSKGGLSPKELLGRDMMKEIWHELRSESAARTTSSPTVELVTDEEEIQLPGIPSEETGTPSILETLKKQPSREPAPEIETAGGTEEKETAVTVEPEREKVETESPAEPPHPGRVETGLTVIISFNRLFVSLRAAELLENLGFATKIAFSGPEIFEKIDEEEAEGKASVVILDLLVPSPASAMQSGGLDIMKELSDSYPSTPVIITVPASFTHSKKEILQSGAVAVIQEPSLRPFNEITIKARLEQFAGNLARQVCKCLPSLRFTYSVPSGEPHLDENLDKIIMKGPEKKGAKQQPRTLPSQVRLLRNLMEEIQTPVDGSEISLLVLRLASEYFERGVLFVTKFKKIYGLGGFGPTGDSESMPQKVKKIRFPLEEDSIFQEAMTKRTVFQGSPDAFPQFGFLIEMLGTIKPTEIVLLPIHTKQKVFALLYGDNGASGNSIDNLEGLEIFLGQAGLALENSILVRKLGRPDEKT